MTHRVDPASSPLAARSKSGTWAKLAPGLLGMGFLVGWIALFMISLRHDLMVFGTWTWVPVLPFMGGDFRLNIDHIVRVRALGFLPHQVPGDFYCAVHPYPPMIARCFGWVLLFDTLTASMVWQVALVAFAVVGSIEAARTRRRLGLDPISVPLIAAAILWSAPFLYALERGQCDPMLIPPLIIAGWLLSRRGTLAELGVGALLGLTAWIKYYPGLAVIAPLMLGRRKAVATFLVVVACVGVYDFEGIRESMRAGLRIQNALLGQDASMFAWGHSTIEMWRLQGFVRSSSVLRAIPAAIIAPLILFPAAIIVGRRVASARNSDALTLPYMLWLVSGATFALPYTNDYNLAPLPLAILAVWDRRDRGISQLMLALSILWLQPIALPIDGRLLFGLKVGTMAGVGICLVARASQDRRGPQVGMPATASRMNFVRARRFMRVEHVPPRP